MLVSVPCCSYRRSFFFVARRLPYFVFWCPHRNTKQATNTRHNFSLYGMCHLSVFFVIQRSRGLFHYFVPVIQLVSPNCLLLNHQYGSVFLMLPPLKKGTLFCLNTKIYSLNTRSDNTGSYLYNSSRALL